MAGTKLDLGGLQKLLIVHEEALKSKKVEAFDKLGNKIKVDAAKLKTATDALNAASASLTDVCQQGVLAIEVDPTP